MIHPAIPPGIADQTACNDCPAVSASPGSKGEHGVFNRVLKALIGGPDTKAASAFPIAGVIVDKANTPDSDMAGALSLQPPTLSAEYLDGAADSGRTAGAGPGSTVDAQPQASDRTEDPRPISAWVFLAQAVLHPAAAQEPVHDDSYTVGLGATTSATLAGGRQQLPSSSLSAESDGGGMPGIAVRTSAQSDAQADPSRLLMADATPRPAHSPSQPVIEAHASAVSERLLEPARTATSREVMSLQLPVRAPGWDGELAQRIVWMAGRQVQWADISLNPPNLGNLEVHLSLRGNDASAYFFSPHAAVREAIDDNLSRLREMLAGAGINLGQTQVSQESFGDHRGEVAMRFSANGVASAERGELPPIRSGLGLVDLYV